jgi:geranylgeranyl reductase family protein
LLLDRDRFPRDKVCGDAITPTGVGALRELGLLGAVESASDERVSTMTVHIRGFVHRVSLPVPVIISRRCVLDAVLFEAAAQRADTRQGWRVDELLVEGSTVRGVAGTADDGGRFEVWAKAVVGADGQASVVTRKMRCRRERLGSSVIALRAYYDGVAMAERTLEFHFTAALAGAGYFWVFPAGDKRFNVGVGMLADRMRSSGRTLKQWFHEIMTSPPLRGRFDGARPISATRGGVIPLTGANDRLHGDGFLLVGDAAGLADPFWGDGIDTAMISGLLAGAHLERACRAGDCGADRLAAYARGIDRILGPKRAAGFEMQKASIAGLDRLARQYSSTT